MGLPSISVIVTTYNWPQALDRVLAGLAQQSYRQFEIIVADDGSTAQTAQLIAQWQQRLPFPLQHCWQPDEGFRAAMSRNRAAALAKNDYLIFLDGDCVPLVHFVARHAQLAQTGWFVAGNRILLNQAFTEQVLASHLPIEQYSFWQWTKAQLTGKCNRLLPLIHLPLGPLRKLAPMRWQGAKTCNLAMWRQDYLAVNGMDESFQGWGFEDSDLVIRLQRANIKRKSAKYGVPVIHLWHPEQDKSKIARNAQRLAKTLENFEVRAKQGVAQYL